MAKKSMVLKQQAKPKFSSRAYNRCKICGRPHAYLRDFGICRICFRELAYKGENPDTDPILGDLGCVAVPEFGTKFVRGMVKETHPSTFAELVSISGLSHGTARSVPRPR